MGNKFENVRCPICDTTGQWQCVDEHRNKPEGMYICQNCGMVNYPDTIEQAEKLKEFYREEYREAPTVQNMYTGTRKLFYHGAFLGSLFQQWKKEGLVNPAICEIGAAFGMFLDWVRFNIPQAKVFGTELTKTYRRVAYHMFNLKLDEDFDASQKYDLICSYKVAEHQVDVDKFLRTYVESLTPNGKMYISVPCWFGSMTNFGVSGFSLDYYYHKNHVNVWTRKLFETLLLKVGLEIEKQNHTYYDSTYLCKRNDALMSAPREFEKYEEIIAKMAAIKKASLLHDSGDFKGAIATYPNFPEAYRNLYELSRAQQHQLGFDGIYKGIIAEAITACPQAAQMHMFAGDLCMRYDNWAMAIGHFETVMEMRPNDTEAQLMMSQCFRQLASLERDTAKKEELIKNARNIMRSVSQTSMQTFAEAKTWEMRDNADLPTPWENN